MELILILNNFEEIIERGDVMFHPTTPFFFECEKGCMCCCSDTFFFPSEVIELPEKIKQKLTKKMNYLITPQPFFHNPDGSEGGCIFFNPKLEQHCTIHKYRPLRCKLYPFLPLITKDKIVIICDSFSSVFGSDKKYQRWFRCYGLGKGKNIKLEIENQSRTFLRNILNEYPKLISLYYKDEKDIDSLIDKISFDFHKTPLYNSWSEFIVSKEFSSI